MDLCGSNAAPIDLHFQNFQKNTIKHTLEISIIVLETQDDKFYNPEEVWGPVLEVLTGEEELVDLHDSDSSDPVRGDGNPCLHQDSGGGK